MSVAVALGETAGLPLESPPHPATAKINAKTSRINITGEVSSLDQTNRVAKPFILHHGPGAYEHRH